MLDTAIFSRIRTAAGRFAGANQGNIAVLFAIAAVPILSFVGAAIDYTRANTARTAMQAALDSTALMLAKDLTDGIITTSQIEAKATSYFTALYTNTDAKSVVINAGYTPEHGQRFDHSAHRLRNGRHRLHEGRRVPESQFQHRLHLSLGQYAHARRDGAG